MPTQTAFGGMLRDVVELNSIVLRPEPLDDEIERRCKQAWEQARCPECGETAIQSGGDSSRVWCRNCRYTFTKFTEDRNYRITADILEQYAEVYVLSYYELNEESHERAVWKTDDAIAHQLTRQD